MKRSLSLPSALCSLLFLAVMVSGVLFQPARDRRRPVKPIRSCSTAETRRSKSARGRARGTYFSELLESYPQSPLRADAKLGVGDSFLGENNSASYVYAQNEYREFLAFYPTNPQADYAQMQLGMVHFNQMLNPQRDQTETKEAIKEFQTFVDRYPNSPLITAGEAAAARGEGSAVGLRTCRSANFYLSIRLYAGAEPRYRHVLENGPRIHPQRLPLLPPGGNPRKVRLRRLKLCPITSAS